MRMTAAALFTLVLAACGGSGGDTSDIVVADVPLDGTQDALDMPANIYATSAVRADETGAPWMNMADFGEDGFDGNLVRFDAGAQRWRIVARPGQAASAFSSGAHGELLLTTTDPFGGGVYRLYPDATTLGEPLLPALDLDGDGLSNLRSPVTTDTSGAFYAYAHSDTDLGDALVRFPGRGGATYDLVATAGSIADAVGVADGSVVVEVAGAIGDPGFVIQRFAPDGSPPVTLADRCATCEKVGLMQWDGEVGFVHGVQGSGSDGIYQLGLDGTLTYIATDALPFHDDDLDEDVTPAFRDYSITPTRMFAISYDQDDGGTPRSELFTRLRSDPPDEPWTPISPVPADATRVPGPTFGTQYYSSADNNVMQLFSVTSD